MKYSLLSVLLASAFALTACSEEATTPAKTETATASVATVAKKPAGSLIERINAKGTVWLATEGNYPPFTFHDKTTGKLTGYDVEVARAVADKLGITIEFKEMPWVGILPGLKNGEFDLVANQVSLNSAENKAAFDKSEPYSWDGKGIMTLASNTTIHSLEDIAGKRAAQSPTSSYGKLATEKGATITPVESIYQAATFIQSNRADLTINSTLGLLYHLKENNADGKLKLAWAVPTAEQTGAGLIVVKGNDEALNKISEAVRALKADGTLKRLGEQFFGQDVSAQTEVKVK